MPPPEIWQRWREHHWGESLQSCHPLGDAERGPFHDHVFRHQIGQVFAHGQRNWFGRIEATDGSSAALEVTVQWGRLGPLPARVLVPAARHHVSLNELDHLGSDAAVQLLGSLQHLRTWDLLRFRAVPAGGLLHRTAEHLGATIRSDLPSHSIPLQHEPFISSGRARELRRLARKLRETTGAVPVIVRSGDPGMSRIIAGLALLHRTRWRGTATPSPFEDTNVTKRFVELLSRPDSRWPVIAAAWMAADKPVAAVAGFDDGVRMHAWRIAYQADLRPFSPVLQLLTMMALHAKESGRDSLELGQGDDQYKQAWRTTRRHRVTVMWHRRSLLMNTTAILGKIAGMNPLKGWGVEPWPGP